EGCMKIHYIGCLFPQQQLTRTELRTNKRRTMRKLQIVLMAGLWLAVPALSQEQQAQSTARSFWDYGVPNGRTFFPHDWVRGFTQFEGAPPHNEPDLGRCGATNPPQGARSPCTAFARYMISGYMEVQ